MTRQCLWYLFRRPSGRSSCLPAEPRTANVTQHGETLSGHLPLLSIATASHVHRELRPQSSAQRTIDFTRVFLSPAKNGNPQHSTTIDRVPCNSRTRLIPLRRPSLSQLHEIRLAMSNSHWASVPSIPSPPPRFENWMDPIANRKQFPAICIRTNTTLRPHCPRVRIVPVIADRSPQSTQKETTRLPAKASSRSTQNNPAPNTYPDEHLRQRLQHPATPVLLCPSSRILHRIQQKRRQPDHRAKVPQSVGRATTKK